MKKLYYLLPFLLLLISCGGNPDFSRNELVYIDLKGVIKHKPVDIELQDISNHITEIPLETTDSSLINRIDHQLYDGDQFYIMANNNVLIFDNKGSFIRAFGHKGDDPEGFVYIESIVFTDNEINLYDRNKKKILRYSKSGDYLGQFSSPESFQNIAVLDKDLYVGYIPNVSGNAIIKMGFFNSGGFMVDSILQTLHHENPIIIMLYFNECEYHHTETELICKDVFCDTIYTVGKGNLIPRYALDLGDKGAKPNARGEMVNQRDNVFKDMYQVLLKGETDKYLFLTIVNLGGDVLYDKKEKTPALYKVKYKKNDLAYTIHKVGKEFFLIGEYWDEETEDNPTLILATLNK